MKTHIIPCRNVELLSCFLLFQLPTFARTTATHPFLFSLSWFSSTKQTFPIGIGTPHIVRRVQAVSALSKLKLVENPGVSARRVPLMSCTVISSIPQLIIRPPTITRSIDTVHPFSNGNGITKSRWRWHVADWKWIFYSSIDWRSNRSVKYFYSSIDWRSSWSVKH